MANLKDTKRSLTPNFPYLGETLYAPEIEKLKAKDVKAQALKKTADEKVANAALLATADKFNAEFKKKWGYGFGEPDPVKRDGRTVTAAEIKSANGLSVINGLEAISAYAYSGDTSKGYAIAANNFMIYAKNGSILNTEFFCPSFVSTKPKKETSEVVEAEAEGPAEAKIPYIPFNLSAEQRLAEAKRSQGLTVMIFPRTMDNSIDLNGGIDVTGVTSLRVKSSLFEAVRTAEITWPKESGRFDRKNLYGNHVVIAYNGSAIFMGLLVNPKVRAKKGVTMTWALASHAYVYAKTHINPQTSKKEWTDLSTYDILAELTEDMLIPLTLSDQVEELLRVPVQDSDGLSTRTQDILTTTPVAFLQKLLAEKAAFLTTGDYGHLEAVKPSLTGYANGDSFFFLEGMEDSFGAVTGNFSLDVAYNYGELAATYLVLSQKRQLDTGIAVKLTSFPLPIHKTVERPYCSIDRSEAALFELTKTMAKAVDINLTYPNWINPVTKIPWKIGDVASVLSHKFDIGEYNTAERLSPVMLYVSGVVFEYSKSGRFVTLSLHHPGVFDLRLYVNLPFMSFPNQAYRLEEITSMVDPEDEPSTEEVKVEAEPGFFLDPAEFPAYLREQNAQD